MQKLGSMFAASLLAACVAPVDDDTSDVAQASFAYHTMGFARVSGTAAVTTSFNSDGGAVTAVRTGPPGAYHVSFSGLGIASTADAVGGNVQVVAEGTSNVRCHTTGWGGSTNLGVNVTCKSPDGTAADSAFAVLFFRYAMPAPNPYDTRAAYAYVQASGGLPRTYDYNSSGSHNTVTKTGTGLYTVGITGASAINASMMVTPYFSDAMCSITRWSAGVAYIDCRNRAGLPVDSAFSFSYSTSGPALEQQGGHAWFNGTSASPTYSAALGKVSWCSPASVSGSRTDTLATVVVSGDLGSHDGDEFRRASFVTLYGGPGYCKAESVTSAGSAPSSTGTTTVRCYNPDGTVRTTPRFTLTHVTSDASGPC